MNIDNFKRQHKEILEQSDKLNRICSQLHNEESFKEANKTLAKLAGVLTIHLSMEDRHLYPKSISSTDTNLSNIATSFQGEMGGISESFKSYKSKWSKPGAIAQASSEFRSETKDIVAILAKRINREEKDFYPLIK